jgi:hypothetical protein
MTADKVEALLHPRNIVLVGASDRPRHWSGRVRANLARFGYGGGIYPINPRREEIWGGPCYGDFDALPEPPDHIVSFIPADAVFGVLEAGAAAGARSAPEADILDQGLPYTSVRFLLALLAPAQLLVFYQFRAFEEFTFGHRSLHHLADLFGT